MLMEKQEIHYIHIIIEYLPKELLKYKYIYLLITRWEKIAMLIKVMYVIKNVSLCIVCAIYIFKYELFETLVFCFFI